MKSSRLREAMEAAGVNATKLSEMTGIGKSSLSGYINGKVEPNEARKRRICDALGLPPNFFETEQEESDPAPIKNLPVDEAARLMQKSRAFIHKGLQDGVFPFGYAVKMPSGQWSYYISPAKFTEYTGVKINADQMSITA